MAVTFVVAFPVVCGDLMVVIHVVAAFGHVVAALPM
jgi:hypothetical protein